MSYLDNRIVALQPELLDGSSAWVRHIPFAFWIIDAVRPGRLVELGTHTGVSYCAFCQAIEERGLNTVAHAIDTWQGDAHSGEYFSDIYDALKVHHDNRYAGFSDLVRSTFDDAAEKFPDGSIDLLHIDGLHTFDAVKHDFEIWRPKLSSRAVVLFHDTNVYERDFGVQEYWSTVSKEYPSFEFVHGHGLGVLAVGEKQPPAVRWLTSLSQKKVRRVRDFFAATGRHLGKHSEAIVESENLRADLTHVQKERDLAVAALASTRDHAMQIATANDEIHIQNIALAAQVSQLQSRRQEADERDTRAIEADLQEQVDWLIADNQRFFKDNIPLKVSNQQLRADRSTLREDVSKLESDIQQLYASSSWRLTRSFRWLGNNVKMLRNSNSSVRVIGRALCAPGGIRKGFAALSSRGLTGSLQRVDRQIADAVAGEREGDLTKQRVVSADEQSYTDWIAQYDSLTDDDRLAAQALVNGLEYQPLISILVPVYNTRPAFLAACLNSVIAQLYTNWQLCITDDASTNSEVATLLAEYERSDARVQVCYRPTQGGIAVASNTALELARGDFVALLDHDDTLPEHALSTIVNTLNKQPDVDLLYSDEDKIDEHGYRHEPYFKTDYNYELLLGQNCISHFGVYRRSLLEGIDGFREGFDGSQDHDLALRASVATVPEKIVHIPHVLYHWRVFAESGSFSTDQLPASMRSAAKAITEHLQKKTGRPDAQAVASGFGCFHRVIWPRPQPEPSVGIIVPTRDNPGYLAPCIHGLLNQTDYKNLKILIVDNGSVETQTDELLRRLEQHAQVRVIRDERPFNFSQLNNHAADQIEAEFLCLLNDDTEVIDAGWLGEMVALASRDGIGAVGARLLFPDDTVQHGGIVLGNLGIAGHFHRHMSVESPGYFGRLQLCQEVSAVTAACMLVRKSIYVEVGGLNEVQLSVAFNDIDFCLRLRALGYRNLWTPEATLYHKESASRGLDREHWNKRRRNEREVKYLQERWGAELDCDNFYNPNLTLEDTDMSLAFPPRVALPWRVKDRGQVLAASGGSVESESEEPARVEAPEVVAAPPFAGIAPRSAYKETWNSLAEIEEQARISVGGFSDEATFVFTGEATMSVLQRTVGINQDDDVLEIGCGVARVGHVLAPHCATWTGCDVSANMLRHASTRVSTIENIRLVELSGFDLSPIADAAIDVVYCTVVFMHLDEWDRYNYLREALRVLRPGGRVFVDNFTIETSEGWAVFEECLAYDPLTRPSHTSKSSTTQEITTFLAHAGFEAVSTELEAAWVRGWGWKPERLTSHS